MSVQLTESLDEIARASADADGEAFTPSLAHDESFFGGAVGEPARRTALAWC